MTFIPNILTNNDPNNSYIGNSTGTYIGTSTITTGYNTIILTIQSTSTDVDSASGEIQIYLYSNGETPAVFYSDTYTANTLYIKKFTITKKNYYIKFVPKTNSPDPYTLNINSRLSTELDSSDIYNNPATFNFSEEFALDAFGKLRVSNPVTLLDIRFPGQSIGTVDFLKNTLLVCSDISGNFSSTPGNSQLLISSTGTGAGHYISQSRKFCTYQPGKSLLFMASGIICPSNSEFSTSVSGYIGRIGYYSNNYVPGTPTPANYTVPYNGLYFQYNTSELNSSQMSINVANNGSITTYLQSEWNLDTMDGGGPSGLNLDFKRAQLFVMDMEWLGVGRVRFGFYAYGKIQYCHQISNINILKNPYTGNINLPVRYELIGDSTATLTAQILQICSTVISEGGFNPIGKPFSVSLGTNSIALNDENLEVPILILRPSMNTTSTNNNNYHCNIIPNQVTMINTSNSNLTLLILRLYQSEYTSSLNNLGTITWNEINSDLITTTAYLSAAQYSTSYSTPVTNSNLLNTTGSIVLDYKYFYGNLSSSVNSLGGIFSDTVLHLTTNIQGQSDYLVITAINLSANNSKIYVSLNWTEVL